MIRDGDAAGEDAIVGVGGDEGDGELGGELVELRGLDAVVDAGECALGDEGGIHIEGRHIPLEAGADLDAHQDLVKAHIFPSAVPLDHLHTDRDGHSGIEARSAEHRKGDCVADWMPAKRTSMPVKFSV